MKLNYFFITAILLFSGCIKNDIPYPVQKGLIKEIEFSGQESAEIDNANMTVNVILKDTTDIQNVHLLKFSISDKTVCNPTVNAPMTMNLSKDYSLVLSTYQDYNWTIKTTQPVNRSARVNWQVGKAQFDEKNHTALIEIAPGIDKANLTVKNITFASEENSTVSPDPASVTDFSKPVIFTVLQHGRSVEWTVTVQNAETAVLTNSPDEIWAKRAVLSGNYMVLDGEDMLEVGFEYRRSDETNYTKVNDVMLNDGEATFTLVTEPSTTYFYRIYQGNYRGKEVSFKTDLAPTIPNLSLENWYKKEKVWYPCLESEWGKGENYAGFWNTGNSGVTLFEESNVYPVSENGGTAACLETIKVAVVKLAAGNLFVGNFITVLADPLKSTQFGRPFTGRPTKLVGKYKYFPKQIDVANTKDEDIKKYLGQMDRCIMWINLEDWKGATKRPENPTVIARGEFRGLNTVSDYTDFELLLDYKDKSAKPTHICIVFSASEYGDYYTGGVGTKLFVDNLQLLY